MKCIKVLGLGLALLVSAAVKADDKPATWDDWGKLTAFAGSVSGTAFFARETYREYQKASAELDAKAQEVNNDAAGTDCDEALAGLKAAAVQYRRTACLAAQTAVSALAAHYLYGLK